MKDIGNKKQGDSKMKIRALERTDLKNIHIINNEAKTMHLWFQEPYESLDELTALYDKHIHSMDERRFVVDVDGAFAGIVELMEINFIHRSCEIQLIITEECSGRGLAQEAFHQALEYAFKVLNMHKVYLWVDVDNAPAVHIYEKVGFKIEGTMKEHFFAAGSYHDSHFMGLLKKDYLK